MKKYFVASVLFLLPIVGFAGKAEQCALNSTCSFTIRGKFNKEFFTPSLQPGRIYVCKIIRGKGQLLSVKNVYASRGVRYEIQGRRLDSHFIIYAPRRRSGYIRYTMYNHNDPWKSNSFQFKCRVMHRQPARPIR